MTTRENIQKTIDFIEELAEDNVVEWRNQISKKIGSDSTNEEHYVSIALKALRQMMGWTSILKRLPTKEDADKNGLIMAYSKEFDQITVCKWWYVLDDEVTTHWQKTPESPKEAINEN